ncbi:MAG: formylglycine-generating enzyme family protein [SAR324 cluster bacterium]|nr:formylglycine-generating enzyme family protein [SAR324 cluster bacterium]
MRFIFPFSLFVCLLFGSGCKPAKDISEHGPPKNFIRIKPDQFEMGNKKGHEDEQPVRLVHITKPFYISDHEVTVLEFAEFVESTGYKTEVEQREGCYFWTGKKFVQEKDKNWKNPGFSQQDDHPVVCVSWNDTQAFIEWKNQLHSNYQVRLCREAEWEYAAKGKSETPYFWGDETSKTCEYANGGDLEYREKYPLFLAIKCNDGFANTGPVKSFQKNPFGLYDMSGNVLEWVQDWYGKYPDGEIDDPKGPFKGSRRVGRGGSWYNSADSLRSTHRVSNLPHVGGSIFGFRLCAD